MLEEKIMDTLNKIEYGFKDELGNNILLTNPKKWDEEIYDFYYLQTPEELLNTKCGVCYEQVELERKLFAEYGINVKTYFICTYDGENVPSHTFLTFTKEGYYYWFEHSWGEFKGIHKYKTEKELLLDVKDKFISSNPSSESAYTLVYLYETPKFHINCKEFYAHCEKGKLIKLNEPLYFYHVVDKNANLSIGLLSLQYMYDNKMYDLFDKNAEKYKSRITNSWNIEKYKGREESSLTREEIIDALNIFRGNYGSSYIYFFKFPPYKSLGKKIEELLKVKDIYRININDENVQKITKEIFYGFNGSNSDNKILNRKYYETITKEEYFKNYDDTLIMNFSKLNHISIAFENNYCPIKYLEKCKKSWKLIQGFFSSKPDFLCHRY